MKQELMLSAEQNSLLKCIKAGYKIPAKSKKSLIKCGFIRKNNQITKLGQTALDEFQDHIKRDQKTVHLLSNLIGGYDILIAIIAIIEMLVSKSDGFLSTISIMLLILIVLMIISVPIFSHLINKHYHLK